ncbi:MAG: VPLPA-CTERM sorting domain-containing protein [Gammaproteobacteria bacterium]|nr:VPLPA-CTERM sorting domain-containing protein [Gammaproteobacteria bacterium]
MKKFLLATALALTTGVASAATLTITGGNWDSSTTWNNNAPGDPNTTFIYQNGDAIPTPQLGGVPNAAFTWNDDTGAPRTDLSAFTGTIGGTLEIDDGTGAVIGGSLVITGTIGDQVVVGTNSWWLRIWEDVSINLATGSSTVGSVDCARSAFAPANCFPGVLGGMPSAFDISGGAVTPGGCYLPGATNDPANDPTSTALPCGPNGPPVAQASWDGSTLTLHNEGRDAAGNVNGTDLQNAFSLTVEAQVIPVPAAVWLFGSALGLLGWMRRRA